VAVAAHRAVARVTGHRDTPPAPSLVGGAELFQKATALIPIVANTNRPVLISGETGTGKELVARAIHGLSDRACFPFVPVNCGSLVDTLVDDALFGHEPGAFTDARQRHRGLLMEAQGGTVFLDELEALSLKGQVTLLRVLEDGAFRPLGSSRLEYPNVRFLTATNAPLEDLVKASTFRPDLYYRLSVFRIDLPSLRERRDDIVALAVHFLRTHAPSDSAPLELDDTARAALMLHEWPGNVRELENMMVRAIHMGQGATITAGDLGLAPAAAQPHARPSYQVLKQEVIARFETDYLRRVIFEHRGNVTHAARAVGKERRELGKLLRKYQIDPRTFRDVTPV
jgi:DNA-binding NtrC family response regulator